MGFRTEKQSGASCIIKAVLEGDDSSEFLLCVQEALKNLKLDITVDMSQKPYALNSIMPLLLKLQRVMANHHKIVVMKGVHGRVSPDFLRQLSEIGIEILQDGVPVPVLRPPTPDIPQGTLMPDGSRVELEVAPPPPPLPPAFEIEKRFIDLKERLAQALKRKRFLDSERRIYQERIRSLSHVSDGGTIDRAKIDLIARLEAQLAQLQTDRSTLQKEFDAAVIESERAEVESKSLISEYQSDHKKKKEILDKTMAELTKKHEKIKQDFKKKSDSRKERLARLGSK